MGSGRVESVAVGSLGGQSLSSVLGGIECLLDVAQLSVLHVVVD